MYIVATKRAYEVAQSDRILVNDVDPIVVDRKIVSGESVLVAGYSSLTNTFVVYLLDPDKEISLWQAS